MQQSVAVITLGVADPARARRFYAEGFGWQPVFAAPGILFYQMNGFVLGLWQREALEEDLRRTLPATSAGFSLAHNVGDPAEVQPLLERLAASGGMLLRAAEAPPHGGLRGYVADPDGHAWEIAWNPDWPIDAEGRVRFAAPVAAGAGGAA
ncbi:VOC family protein [Pseudoroseomonas cervicalis]|uniref:VOC family protein n=1 Tax=Teichococcus cervicalis TaxID=204525 RepID=UPI0022F1D104|nr:VOC family protein [Pseudoroseomonas cervicalis]WBV44660.1 VOC family protein [Pseudoroseomonas cervicalis]